jgi:hypothetical protein
MSYHWIKYQLTVKDLNIHGGKMKNYILGIFSIVLFASSVFSQLKVQNDTDVLMVVTNEGKAGMGITEPKAHLSVIGSLSRVTQIGD